MAHCAHENNNSFIYSFTHLFVYIFIYLLIHSFIYSFILNRISIYFCTDMLYITTLYRNDMCISRELVHVVLFWLDGNN